MLMRGTVCKFCVTILKPLKKIWRQKGRPLVLKMCPAMRCGIYGRRWAL